MAELLDNRAKRIQALKEIITGLHQGTPQDQVRRQLKELVRQTDTSEIAAMEQQLIAEGMPVAEVMAMCDLHSQVVSEILVNRPIDPVLPGHPVDTFRRENQAILAAARALREESAALLAGRDEEPADLGKLQLRFNALMDIDKHYARKENLLRYFAVRGEGGQYLGTLEVTQDLSEARALQGERRLLEYDPHPA